MSVETPLRLLRNIDEPGLHDIEVYERLGGYKSLRKALGAVSYTHLTLPTIYSV